MTGFSAPKSDRELWGLRGAVKVCEQQYLRQNRDPSGPAPPVTRLEFNLEGRQSSRTSADIPFTFDHAGRKMRVRVSRPEDYIPNLSMGGLPFSMADRRPNLAEGGTSTTYYDEHERPVEAEVRDSRGGLAMRAVRVYYPMGRVVEEKLTTHDMSTFVPRHQDPRVNRAVKEWLTAKAGDHAVQFFYDADNIVRMVRREAGGENTLVTSYNSHGDPELETMAVKSGIGAPSYSETRFSYQYDQVGNWTEKSAEYRSGTDDAFQASYVIRRTLEYF